MTHTDAERAAWKSDRETLERDALAFLRLEERSVEELTGIYEAASATFQAWVPLDGFQEQHWTKNLWSRESERAFIVMGAVAERLAAEAPERTGIRNHVLAVLADWNDRCDDNPNIATAMLRLLALRKA